MITERKKEIGVLDRRIIRCKKCARLSAYIRNVARHKVRRFNQWSYWGKPLPGFGDSNAKLLIIGLAPAAHGGNRTGRMFTGDSSGDWLARTLYDNGFATRSRSERIGDGFVLVGAYITASLRCAPPKNKPTRNELDNCSCYLETELKILKNLRVIICLGRIAFDSCSKVLHIRGIKFSHGKIFEWAGKTIILSYHPSRQNTQTGRLQWNDWNFVFLQARRILDETNKTSNNNSYI